MKLYELFLLEGMPKSKYFLENSEDLNAPSLAYYARTGKIKNIYGRYAHHDSIMIKGIPIDKNIPKSEMIKLLNNKNIEMRSSCEGSDLYGPFFIFRLPGKDEEYINNFCKYMNKGEKDIICKYGIGRNGEYRTIVTSSNLFDKMDENYISWWKRAIGKLDKYKF